jgi:hypothetical protein
MKLVRFEKRKSAANKNLGIVKIGIGIGFENDKITTTTMLYK